MFIGGAFMSVYKKNSKWYMRGKVKKEDATYKDYHKACKDCRLKKEAEEFEREFKKKYNEDVEARKKGDYTFKQYYEEVYRPEKILSNAKPTSIAADDVIMRKCLVPIHDLYLHLIKSSTIKQLLDKMKLEGYSVSYIDKVRKTINAIYNYAIKYSDMAIFNPVSKIKEYKEDVTKIQEMQFFTPQEWKLFESTYDKEDYIYFTFFCVLYYTGMRRGEAMALTPADIDLDNNKIRVNKTCSLYINDNDFTVITPKTKNSNRVIRIPQHLHEILEEYMKRYKKIIGTNRTTFLFGVDRPLQANSMRRKFNRTCKQAGLSQIRIHDLRHSHASLLINSGANDKAVADRFGNTVTEVRKTYSHLFDSTDREMVDLIDNIFPGKNKKTPDGVHEDLEN